MKTLFLAALLLAPLAIALPAGAAQQAIKNKADCAKVGGKVGPNIYSDGTYPHLCVYPDKYDKQCKRKLDETAYYDIAQKKCVSELMCDLEGEC